MSRIPRLKGDRRVRLRKQHLPRGGHGLQSGLAALPESDPFPHSANTQPRTPQLMAIQIITQAFPEHFLYARPGAGHWEKKEKSQFCPKEAQYSSGRAGCANRSL